MVAGGKQQNPVNINVHLKDLSDAYPFVQFLISQLHGWDCT